jgi:hypothetical protein
MGYKKYEKKSKTMRRKEKRKDETAMLCGQSKGANEIREDEGMRIVPVGAGDGCVTAELSVLYYMHSRFVCFSPVHRFPYFSSLRAGYAQQGVWIRLRGQARS